MPRPTVQLDLTDGRPAPDGGSGRRLGQRRRALPGGRTVAGGFLIAVAAVVVFAAVLSGTRTTGSGYVVAARTLAPGTVLGPGDLTTATMRLAPAATASAFGQPSSLEGRTLAVGVQAGQLIESSLLVPVGGNPGLRPVSVAVDPTSLTGLAAGQAVDVLATAGGGTSGGAVSVTVVMRGATLISASNAGSALSVGSSSAQVTLGVATLSEVESIVAAAHAGNLTLVAAERSDGVGPGPGPGG